MTMILGVHLTDQIYLAGDTRVTYMDSNGSATGFEDTVIKVAGVVDSPDYKLSLAVAGDVELASFMTSRLAYELKAKTLNRDISCVAFDLTKLLF